MGLGLLGLLAVQMMKAAGFRVMGFDPDASRCRLALDLGADRAVSSDLKAACKEFSRGYGVDAVLITAAAKSNEPVTLAGEICRMKGTVVVTGLVGMDLPRDMYYKKELDFKLSLSYGPGRYDPAYEEGGRDYPYGYVRWTEQRNIQAFLDLVASGAVTPSKLVTHRFDIDDALNTLCTATGMNAGQTAQKEGFACATTDFQVVLDNEQINTVFVTTRHNSHARFVTAALAAGKHVFVEKPLCLTPEDLQTIHQTLHKSPHTPDASPLTPHSPPILMVGFNRRFSPHAAFIRDYFQGRQTPMMVNYRINAGIIPPDVWVQDPEVGGGRIVGEVCHFIDFASFVIGADPVAVQAMCVDSTNASLVAEDNVTIAVKYRDGSVAQICYVAVGPSDLAKEYCEVFADESAAVMDNFCTTRCMGRRGKKRLKGSQKKGFTQEIAAFLKAVKTGGPSPIPFDSLALTTACTFAAKESLRTRTAVGVTGVGSGLRYCSCWEF
jgi:predicted dehydrogenase